MVGLAPEEIRIERKEGPVGYRGEEDPSGELG